jgi:hypothetical protein
MIKEVVEFIHALPGEESCYELYFGGLWQFFLFREGMRVVDRYLRKDCKQYFPAIEYKKYFE